VVVRGQELGTFAESAAFLGREDVWGQVQEAGDEAALGIVHFDAEGFDDEGFVGETGEVRRVGEPGVFVVGVRFGAGMGEKSGSHVG
jgi:hypothetical protein